MPILALSLGTVSILTRYVRSAMIDVMNEDFIRTAMSQGTHARRGAAIVPRRPQRVGISGHRRRDPPRDT